MEKVVVALSLLGFLKDTDKKESFDMSRFYNRLFYQKLIFLLCEKTSKLKYSYNWYIRGPYSPDLSKDLFNIQELWEKNNFFLKKLIRENSEDSDIKDAVESINILKSKFNEKFNRDWNEIDLEILASLVFIEKYTYERCKKSKDKTLEEFSTRKAELVEQYIIGMYWDILNSTKFV